MKKRCVSAKYTMARVAGEMIGMIGRVFRSFLFNILVFTLGVSAGYSYVATRVHYHASHCGYDEYIQKICDTVDSIKLLDEEYEQKRSAIRELASQLKDKMSHDVHSECTTKLGDLLIRDKL